MKKTVLFIIAVLMIVSAGCSSSSSENNSGDVTDSTNNNADPADKSYKISWVPLSRPVDEEGAIVKYMEDKFNVELELWNDEAEALAVRLSTGEIPDRMEVKTVDFKKFIDNEVIAEIPIELVKKHAPNLYQKYVDDLGEDVFKYATVDGKLYGLPVINPESGGARKVIAWRGDWLKNVGIDKVPETLTELEEAVYKFTNNDPDQNGKKDTFGLSSSMMDSVYGAFGYLPTIWQEKDGELVYGGIQPEMKEALTILRKWHEDGVISPDWVNADESKGASNWTVSTPFAQGVIGVSAHASFLEWKIGRWDGDREGENITTLRNSNPNAEVLYGKPPAGPNGNKGVLMEAPLHTRYVTFGKHVENDPGKMARILEMADYADGTIDGFILNRFGIEGQHWKWSEDLPKAVPIAIEPYNAWMEITKEGGGIAFSSIWMPSNVAEVNSEYMWRMEEHPELNEDGYINEASMFSTESQKKYLDELNTLQSNAFREIINGNQTIDYFDEFVKQWKSLGGDELAKDYNEIYQNWK